MPDAHAGRHALELAVPLRMPGAQRMRKLPPQPFQSTAQASAPMASLPERARLGELAEEDAHVPPSALLRTPRADSGGWPPDTAECPPPPAGDGAAPRGAGPGLHLGRARPAALKGAGGLGQRKGGERKRPIGAGASGKLSVQYGEGEEPMQELLRLTGGQGAEVVVEAVAPGSKAEKAGVRPGFVLAAMNGRSEFMQLPGWQVRLLLDAPITLGFDPPPAAPKSTKYSEIRLASVDDALGIPPRVAVCGPKETGVLAEEVVFQRSSAPLWLSARAEEGAAPEAPGPRLYELRRQEAHALVGQAVRGARERSPPQLEAERSQSAASRSPRRSPSPAALCSMDCVAECLEDELVVGRDAPAHRKVSPRQRAGGTGRADLALKTPGHRLGPSSPAAAKEPPGGVRPADAKAWPEKLGSGTRDDRSPLRWFAPVLERVWGESPSPRGGASSPGPSCSPRDRAAPCPRPAVTRGSSPKPVGANGDNESVADPDLSATMSSSRGIVTER